MVAKTGRMAIRKYTIVCEFRGGTYVSQVAGNDVQEAVRSWADYLAREKPIPQSSTYLAKSVAASLDHTPPVTLDGLSGVWCIFGNCGGDLMLANIVESGLPANGS